MWDASSTMSSCHKVRRSTSKSIKRFCGVRFAQCTRIDESCVKTASPRPVHNALSIRHILPEKNVAILEQRFYSLDLTQCDFFLFPQVDPQWTRFEDVEAMKKVIMTDVGNPRRKPSSSAYKRGREKWKNALDSGGISLNGKLCRLLFKIGINCLWLIFRQILYNKIPIYVIMDSSSVHWLLFQTLI